MLRALVIDDSRAIRIVLTRIVQPIGFAVTEAANGREALAQLVGNEFELALVDWKMPEMTGIEFVRAVRAQRAYDTMRVVMITSETEIAKIAEALEAGADEFIMKPFAAESIVEKLQLIGLIQPV